MGGGRTLKASAAGSSSHSAIQCTVLQSYECDGKACCPYDNGTITDEWQGWCASQVWGADCPGRPGNKHFTGGMSTMYECPSCGVEFVIGEATCTRCGDKYTFTGEKRSDYSLTYRDIGSHYGSTPGCSHGYTYEHTAADYVSCSSSYPCTNGHSSYSTVNHYYCTTHGYVGTSSTCPGLTISPSPSSITVHYGQSSTISANANPSSASVSFDSSNTNVATVSSIGKVTGTGKGNTTITVTGVI